MTSNKKNPLHKYENPGKYYVGLNAFVNDNNFNFVLKPNPVKDVLEVLLARDNYSVRIFSTTGQMVYSNNFTDSRLTIEVKNIKNGLYTLLLIGKNGKSMYKKFVVNHR